MEYGKPQESKNPVRTVFVEVGARAAEADLGAVSARGPLQEGEPLSAYEPIRPSAVKMQDGVLRASFDEALDPGTYRITYNPGGVLDENGRPVEITDEDGRPWSSWTLRVHGEGPERDEPRYREPKARPEMNVYVDGSRVKSGATGVDGETIQIENAPEDAALVLDPLFETYSTKRGQSLFEELMSSREENGMTVYSAVGPPGSAAWAVYPEGELTGRLFYDHQGRMAGGDAVTRRPEPIDENPLTSVSFTSHAPSDHPNEYRSAVVRSRPESPGAPDLVGRQLVWATRLSDPTWTPERDPHLLEGALWREEKPLEYETPVVPVRIPINHRLRIVSDGKTLWEAQTRMWPTASSVGLVRSKGVGNEMSDSVLSERLWRATREAISIWGGPRPETITDSMREFALTRVALGSGIEDGTQGTVRVRTGDHETQAKSAEQLRTRLERLTVLLREGVQHAPVSPEDGGNPPLVSTGSSRRSRGSVGRSGQWPSGRGPFGKGPVHGHDRLSPDSEHFRPYRD